MVIGAGFAGLSATRHLRDQPVAVTIVDHHNFHTFQPLLYQVATAGLDPADVAYPVRTIFGREPNVIFRHGRAQSVDVDTRQVGLADGTTLDYDQLIVATGATTGFFSVPGAPQHALPLYTLSDARRLRNTVLGCLEAADAHPEDFDGGAPTFVVVGGGATGVEISGRCSSCSTCRFAGTGSASTPSAPRSSSSKPATDSSPVSKKRRVATPRRRCAPGGRRPAPYGGGRGHRRRRSASGTATTLQAAAVVWAGGVTVDGTLAATLPTGHGRGGRVALEPDLSVAGHPEVFVVGDAGAVPWGPARPEACPQVAQVAIQSGKHAARQIVRRLQGQSTTAFSYHDKGLMATIGRHAAVAQLRRGPILRGTLGWLAWLGLHLVYLVGFRNRVVVLVNWAWRYLDWPSGPRLIVADVDADP